MMNTFIELSMFLNLKSKTKLLINKHNIEWQTVLRNTWRRVLITVKGYKTTLSANEFTTDKLKKRFLSIISHSIVNIRTLLDSIGSILSVMYDISDDTLICDQPINWLNLNQSLNLLIKSKNCLNRNANHNKSTETPISWDIKSFPNVSRKSFMYL